MIMNDGRVLDLLRKIVDSIQAIREDRPANADDLLSDVKEELDRLEMEITPR